jgi:hypothetical protein
MAKWQGGKMARRQDGKMANNSLPPCRLAVPSLGGVGVGSPLAISLLCKTKVINGDYLIFSYSELLVMKGC